MKKIIYFLTDGTLTTQNFSANLDKTLSIIESAVANNISLIQIREKNLPAKLIFELTAKAVKIAKKSKTKILVNDRADIAFAAKANGVHLTSTSISTSIIRQYFPIDFVIGVSAHSLEKVLLAKKQGADFAVLSPIFQTPNKGEPLGIEKLKIVCDQVIPFPILALGGIDETNFREVLEITDGFAAIRFLQSEENLRKLKDENLSFNRRS